MRRRYSAALAKLTAGVSLMWMTWAVLGCSSPSEHTGPESGEADLALDPKAIDFGSVPLGESAEQSLIIHNEGTSDALVAEVWPSDPDTLTVTAFGSHQIPAGATGQVTVRWTPSETGDLVDGSLDLRVGVGVDHLSDLRVPMAGTVSGPRLTLSDETAELGAVSVGCTSTFEVVATNSGTEALELSQIVLTNDQEFSLQDGAGAPLALPIEIEPGLSAPIDVVYAPSDEESATTTLEITSNDALAPTATVSLGGTGHVDASNSIEWTVEGRQALTAIIDVNDITVMVATDRFEAFLPALFEGLQAARVRYRLGIVIDYDGDVSGDVAYIDDTFTVDEAVAAAEEMLADRSSNGDNDAGLLTCLNAIEENEDWLLDDGDPWRESRLDLMVITYDVEQSGAPGQYFVDLYDDYRDLSDLAVHSIAGSPKTGGCHTGKGVSALPSQTLWDAVEATGGVFIDYCEDWTKSVPALVDGFTGPLETFVLTGTPAPGSIEVSVDGVQLFEGWTYDANTQEIIFDSASYPERGAELRVDYRIAVGCD